MPNLPPLVLAIAGGIVLLGLILGCWLGYELGVRRSDRRHQLLTRQQLLQQVADRERVRLSLEKAQRDLVLASVELDRANDERRHALADCLRLERESAETQELLKEAAQVRSNLEADLRRQRETNKQAQNLESTLKAEKRLRLETDKALSAAGTAAAKAQRELVEALAKLELSQQRNAALARESEEQKTALSRQTQELTEALAMHQVAERRLNEVAGLREQLAAAEQRAVSLERDLAQVTELASTVSAVELDREELEVRLETAAAGVRIARKEADRYRAESIQKGKELVEAQEQLNRVLDAMGRQQRELAEGQAARQRLSTLEEDTRLLRTRCEELTLESKHLATRANGAEQSRQKEQRQRDSLETELRGFRAREAVYAEQSQQLASLGAELAAAKLEVRDKTELQAAKDRLQRELLAAHNELASHAGQTEELGRLREIVHKARHEQGAALEAESRGIALQAELDSARSELAALRQRTQDAGRSSGGTLDQDRESAQLRTDLDEERGAARELRRRLQVAEAQLSSLEQIRADNQALRDEAFDLRQNQQARGQLEDLQREHRKLRLEWELSTRRVEELTAEREELGNRLHQSAQQQQLEQENQELRRRERVLEAQIYALGQTPEDRAATTAAPSTAITGARATEIEKGIAPLVAAGHRTVVLADRQGFVVASSGEAPFQDGLAAFAALVGDVARRVETLLPLSTVQWIGLVDRNRTRVHCRLFDCNAEPFTLSTLGQAALEPDSADGVLATVTAQLTDPTGKPTATED